MAEIGFIPKDRLRDFLETVNKTIPVYVPCCEGDVVLFRRYAVDNVLCLDRPAHTPPKTIIFPQSECLFTFRFEKDPHDPKKTTIQLAEPEEPSEAIIFAARPCDAKGFTIYDRVYIDTDMPDPYYKKRREKTTIVTMVCPSPSPGCFCTAVGGSPANREGADVMMTELENGYVLESLTEKGKALLLYQYVEDGQAFREAAEAKQLEVKNLVHAPFQKEGVYNISKTIFNSDEFWETEIDKCISCGACTYLCPTCYCFNITDEHAITRGERLRNWDACMFFHFTLEASGHNPRPTKYQRFKNRVGHKFLYYPEKYDGVIACCGCGRCIRHCPVSVDIREIVAHLQSSTSDVSNTSEKEKKGD